ncbi:tRNA-specific adenosine deaminase [Bacillus subtilis]|nr:tRNA-specific adenosine deaminase [Bacillus subtilis]
MKNIQQKNKSRASWNEYFMKLAEDVAERATCNRLKVGAIIVKDNRIIGTGYNGSVHNQEHCTDDGCLLNDQGRCILCIHAEMNAILNADRSHLKGSTLYCTHMPCENCAKHIAQVGIVKVIYQHEYKNKYNQYFLNMLEVEQYVKAL